MVSSVLPYFWPGSRIPELPAVSTARPSSSERLKPFRARIHTVITATPAISRQALMICTHVVPFIPPIST
ncbi:Uncharacterised protein [Mycobacteroides abscessus subsp. abscessus]|nr:Uncharacterised protein [Mycobacteroides abscessus subsp. abscessus]